MPFVTEDRWRGREWRAERLGLVDGRAEAVVAAWGAVVRKRLLAPVSAHASLDGVHRFDLDASSRLEWTTAADLAPFETEPGELAHLAEGGAHVSCLRLSRMPDPCVWQHELELPGVRLVYQPALTPEEIAMGCIRPAAVVGSYAAFALDDGRKVCHILRPVAVDGHGNRVWGTIEIAAGISTVRFDPGLLRKLAWGDDGIAIYGLDTFGYTSIGGTLYSSLAHYIFSCGPWAAPANGTVDSLHAYVEDGPSGNWNHCQMAIYPDNGGKIDGSTLLCHSAELYDYNLAGAWETYAVAGSPAMANGVDYWLCYWHDTTYSRRFYDSGSGAQRYSTETYSADNWPDPGEATTAFQSSVEYSLYVTYTPSAGGLSLPVAMHHYRRRRS